MSKLIVIRGNSGSGKTSVARALQRKFGRNTMVLSQDTVRREMLWVSDCEETKALPLLIELIKYGKQNSEVVILEGILDSLCYMPLFQRAVEELGNQIFAYYYDLSFEETLARHQTRPQRNDFGEAHMKKWWKEKDVLSIISEKIISEDFELSDAVEFIYRDVTGK